jgi:hypothetical protein
MIRGSGSGFLKKKKKKTYLFITELIDSAVQKSRLTNGNCDVPSDVRLELWPAGDILRPCQMGRTADAVAQKPVILRESSYNQRKNEIHQSYCFIRCDNRTCILQIEYR